MTEQNIPETQMSSWKAFPSICEIPHYPHVLHAHLLPIILEKTTQRSYGALNPTLDNVATDVTLHVRSGNVLYQGPQGPESLGAGVVDTCPQAPPRHTHPSANTQSL